LSPTTVSIYVQATSAAAAPEILKGYKVAVPAEPWKTCDKKSHKVFHFLKASGPKTRKEIYAEFEEGDCSFIVALSSSRILTISLYSNRLRVNPKPEASSEPLEILQENGFKAES
jgi:hypothetical protein